MALQDRAAKEAELSRLEKEEELARLEAEEAAEQQKTVQVPTESKIETAARSGLEAATLGISEPVISGANAVIGNLIDAGFDAEDLKDFFSKSVDATRIQKEYQKDVARRKELEAKAPAAALAGTLVGAVSPVGPAASLAGLAARGAKAALLGKGAVEAGTALGRIGVSAAEAAASAGATTAGEKAVSGVTGFPSEAEGASVIESALLGAKLGGGVRGGVEAVKGLAAAAPRVLSVLGGPRAEAIEQYLADPEALKRAKSPEAIKELMDETVSKLKGAVESRTLQVQEAKDVLRQAEEQVRTVSQAKKADIADALKEARASFKVAEEELLQPIKQAKPSPALASDIVDAADQLKAKVIKESEQSYKILDDLEKKAQAGTAPRVDLSDIPVTVKNIQEDLKVNGKLISDEEKAAFKALDKYRTELKDLFTDQVSYPQVKRIIQSLDRDVRKFSQPNSAEFSDLSRTKLLELRKSLDSIIKEASPEYAAQMAKVSDSTELLNDVSKFLGKDQRIQGKLEGIWRPSQAQDKDLLSRLGQSVGVDLDTPIAQYAQVKALAQQPAQLRAMAAGLPEAKQLTKAEAQVARLKRPGAEQLLAPKEVAAVQRAQSGVLRAKQMADSAKAVVADVGPFAREYSNFSAIRAAVAQRNPAVQTALESLSSASGKDFTQMINDLRLAESFSKDFTQGSRNVNMFAFMAAGATAALTGSLEAGAILAGMGAGLGKAMDRFGGVATQKVLDGYLKIKGLPTVQKLNAAIKNLPEPVKNYTIGEFSRAISQVKNEELELNEAEAANLYVEIKQSSLDPVTKAKALSDVMSKNRINTEVVKKMMLGEEPKKAQVKPQQVDTLSEDKPDVLKAMMAK